MTATDAVTATIRRIGRASDWPAIQQSLALYDGQHELAPYAGIDLIRDQVYGAHPRHRLDVFRTAGTGARPIFLFVHGGGFIGGDKSTPGSPYNDNVALWAARHGMVGINMTYRLAPEFRFPAGAEDVDAALAWVQVHAAEHGGDPARIILAGTSAGAVHVASFLADQRFRAGARVAGAVLLSCLFDMATCERNPLLTAYFGEDATHYPAQANLPGLLETAVPLLVTLAQYDPADFERQALQFVAAWFSRHGEWPNLVRLMNHSHFTTGLHLNTADGSLSRHLLDFIATVPALG